LFNTAHPKRFRDEITPLSLRIDRLVLAAVLPLLLFVFPRRSYSPISSKSSNPCASLYNSESNTHLSISINKIFSFSQFLFLGAPDCPVPQRQYCSQRLAASGCDRHTTTSGFDTAIDSCGCCVLW
jgi:hypothetical protein